MLPLTSRATFLAIAACFTLNISFASEGIWKFTTEDRGHPELRYSKDDKSIFYVGCGHAFAVHAVYPGPRKEEGTKVAITISNSKARMKLKGEIDTGYEDDPPNTTHFVQWDLGFRRQDPDLYMEKWKKIEGRFFDLLNAGKPLTVSAEDRSYVLPAVNARDWKSQFKKRCD